MSKFISSFREGLGSMTWLPVVSVMPTVGASSINSHTLRPTLVLHLSIILSRAFVSLFVLAFIIVYLSVYLSIYLS